MTRSESVLIAFGSWEDRFKLGFSKDLANGMGRALVFYFGDYAERTAENRGAVEAKCESSGIGCVSRRLSVYDPAANWRTVRESVEEETEGCERVLVDISTMPREVIWYVLWAIDQRKVDVSYVYHTPKNYGPGWLSRDPRTPRLVYKMSGIALPDRRTALLVTAGFDLQRVMRLIYWCEPSVLLVGLQSNSVFGRNSEAMEVHRKEISKQHECRFFELDAYGKDQGLAAVEEEVAGLDGAWNIVMSSLGPKLTAISLYRLQRRQPEIGLVYAPSTEFSEEYSYGIGRAFGGTLSASSG